MEANACLLMRYYEQNVYDDLGLNKTAKATDLMDLIPCTGAKLHGIKSIRIL